MGRTVGERAGKEDFQDVSRILADHNVLVRQGCNHVRNGLGGICAKASERANCHSSDVGDLATHRSAYCGDCRRSNEREHILFLSSVPPVFFLAVPTFFVVATILVTY